MTENPNQFVWHELMTQDARAAKRFYGRVLGWKSLMKRDNYHVALVGGAAVGGIMLLPDYLMKLSPFWSSYVECDDVDLACKRASELGGLTIRAPWTTPTGVRLAVIADPTGGILNLRQTNGHMPRSKTRAKAKEQRSVLWHELHTSNVASAWGFYAKLFDWSRHAPSNDTEGPLVFAVNGVVAGAIVLKHAGLPRPMWFNYFSVRRIESAMGRVQKAGGEIIGNPHQMPTGLWGVSAKDPQNGLFQMASMSR